MDRPISDKHKIEIFEKISCYSGLQNILNFLFEEIDKISKTTGKIFYLIDNDDFVIIKIEFSSELNINENIYLNIKAKIKNYNYISSCIANNEVVKINKENLDEFSANTKAGFKLWDFANTMILIPISKKNKPVIGIIGLIEKDENNNHEQILSIKSLSNFFYNVIDFSVKYEKAIEEKKNFDIIKSRYKNILELGVKINKLMNPDELYKIIIEKFLEIFDFELGFIQIQKNNKLPIIMGSAINKESLKELNKITDYFGNLDNAPLIMGPNGPEMANCVVFINNSHLYFPSAKEILNLPLLEKDRIAISMLERPIETFIIIPISDGNNHIGVLQLWSFSKQIDLTDSDIEMIKSLAGFIPSILNNSELHSQVIKQKLQIEEKNYIIQEINTQIKDELKMAKKIQDNLIPKTPVVENLEIASMYLPMEEIGGDLYDFIVFEEKTLFGVFICDVSGHGVPASLLSAMVKTVLNTSGNLRLSPAKLLYYINNQIIDLMNGNFLTAFYGIIDTKNKTLTYSRGGHNFPFLISNNEIVELTSKGNILGIIENLSFNEVNIDLKLNDKIFLFTDGLTEAIDKNFIPFEEKLKNIILNNYNFSPKDEIMNIYQELKIFKKGLNFEDDVCMISIKIL